jgi:hypothetical protein
MSTPVHVSHKLLSRPLKEGVDGAVRQLIKGADPGKVFTPADFLHLGSRAAVDQTLSRLVRQGVIRRLRRGFYDKPREHAIFGTLLPDTTRIADAIAGQSQLRIQPSGAYAANLLGLSEQVPLKLTFLTDGPSRIVAVGKQTVTLKHTTPKNMATAGRISGLLIQALRYMKQTQMDVNAIAKLAKNLSDADKRILRQDASLAPAWIGKIMRQLGDGERAE